MTDFDYERDKRIDFDELELENDRLMDLVDKYSREVSRLEKIVDNCEEEIKVQRSKIIKEYIEDATNAGEKKPTGPEIEAHYRTHKDHIKAKQNYIDAKHDHRMAEVAKWVIIEKGKRLDAVIKLLSMNYFSRTSRTNGHYQDRKEVSESIKNSRRRRRSHEQEK